MDDPHAVFRWVPRERRARYVKTMRGSMAVAWRDLYRSLGRLGRELGRSLRPR